MEPIYSAAQVAEMLGLTRQRVTQCARRWGIGRKLGREWMFAPADVEAIRDRQGLVGGAGHAGAVMRGIHGVDGESVRKAGARIVSGIKPGEETPSAESVARIISGIKPGEEAPRAKSVARMISGGKSLKGK